MFLWSDLVCEIHADFLEDVTRNLPEVDLVGFVLRELAWTRQHGLQSRIDKKSLLISQVWAYLDGPTGQSVVPLDDELVAVAADQLDVPQQQTNI